ncbi:MAG: HAD family phosphatase [Micromonosporaceae bacterium]|nr:HAD family phosphatase [Micromonosporaceae bacterium]
MTRRVAKTMTVAGRLEIPADTRALLFDMDGVLIDSLAQDIQIAADLLSPYAGRPVEVPRELIQRWFALALDDFWAKITAELGLALKPTELAEIVQRHTEVRLHAVPIVHDGVREIIDAARQIGLSLAVVSNNPAADIERMLAACALLAGFDAVVGNDQPGLARKPAPDPYLAAAARLGLPPGDCAAIEDSVLGLESARRAGCFTIGVATGASSYDDLVHSGLADVCYRDFRGEG